MSLLNFSKVSIESLGGNGTLAVIVAKIHKFFTSVFTASTSNCHKMY